MLLVLQTDDSDGKLPDLEDKNGPDDEKSEETEGISISNLLYYMCHGCG